MSAILREPAAFSREPHDLIVVGGGIYGAMLSLEAARRGLRALVLERGDFGGGTTANNLRTVHGGLRYLQTADLPRFQESVAERRWFLQALPDLVQPLAYMLPLDGRSSRRAWLMRPGLIVNDLFSATRNRGVLPGRRLPRGEILDAETTRARFPAVSPVGLQGSALWHDAFAPDMGRVVIELLRWAARHGGRALNYCAVDEVVHEGGVVRGVRARDAVDGETLEFEAPVVVNAAGPASRAFARAATGRDRAPLFVPSIAWNCLFDRSALSNSAVGVAPKRAGGQVFFAVPWKGRLLAGTGHAAWHGEATDPPRPTEESLEAFVDDLNDAVPGLDLARKDIRRTLAGFLPARSPGGAELTSREVVIDHGAEGELRGLFSVSGIKFTTARRVADKALRLAFAGRKARAWDDFERGWDPGSDGSATRVAEHAYEWMPDPALDDWTQGLRPLIEQEAVVHLEDLVLRRTTLGDNPTRAQAVARTLCGLFDWDDARAASEVARVAQATAF